MFGVFRFDVYLIMCGIAGVLSSTSLDSSWVESTAETLSKALLHRGPDAQGTWVPHDGRALLVHTRLSILDLSVAATQPMLSSDGGLVIIFNGEIYNFQELRSGLEAKGHQFRTHSDTEVLLALYGEHGGAMVHKLRGMFALCIYETETERAFLARDPFGIKPLYYIHKPGGRLCFSSELKALQAASLVSGELDPAGVMSYFRTGSVSEPLTLLKEVSMLPAGHSLTWDKGSTTLSQYWSPTFDRSRPMNAQEATELARSALQDSIRAHFVSDVPVGIFLSGGIDSTALLALAQEAGHLQTATFSIGVDDSTLDESALANRTARHFGTVHHLKRLNGRDGADALQRFINCTDQPSVDGFNTFVVSEFARSQGMKVVLSGLGGDELFGGYPSFRKVTSLQKAARIASWCPGGRRLAAVALNRAKDSKLRRLGDLFASSGSLADAYSSFRSIFALQDARLITAQLTGCSLDSLSEQDGITGFFASSTGDTLSGLELTRYMRNQLLRDSDVMSMAHGLELRVPMVDRVLFERLKEIPQAIRLRSGKRLLLDAVPSVPPWISSQPKRGFVFPFDKWMDAEWKESFEATATVIPVASPTWYQRWALLMFQRWMQRT